MVSMAQAIRDFVAENAGCTGRQIVNALGSSAAHKAAAKMEKRGVLTADKSGEFVRYFIGRPMKIDRSLSKEEFARRKRERLKAHDQRRRAQQRAERAAARSAILAAMPISATKIAEHSGRAETYEEFLARGGKVQVLPGFSYVPPPRMPMGKWL